MCHIRICVSKTNLNPLDHGHHYLASATATPPSPVQYHVNERQRQHSAALHSAVIPSHLLTPTTPCTGHPSDSIVPTPSPPAPVPVPVSKLNSHSGAHYERMNALLFRSARRLHTPAEELALWRCELSLASVWDTASAETHPTHTLIHLLNPPPGEHEHVSGRWQTTSAQVLIIILYQG